MLGLILKLKQSFITYEVSLIEIDFVWLIHILI